MRELVSGLLLLVAMQQTHATGLNFWESSTLNSSLASANGAIANDASVLALAPSSMTQLKNPTVSASIIYYEVTTDYTIFGNQTQYNTGNPIPMGFFVSPINESFFFGLSIYSRTAADITVPRIPLVHPKETRVTPITVSMTPSMAYKIDNISLAASLEYIYVQHDLEQTSCSILGVCETSIQQGNTHGWSGALSATWQINPFISMAVNHRFSADFGVEDIDIELPAITSLYSGMALGKNAVWHITYSYTQWKDKGITYANYNDPVGLLIGSQDSQRLASSLEYQLGDWTLRGGISFDEAIDPFGGIDKRYRLGLGYDISEQIEINAAVVNENYAKKEASVGGTTLVEVQNSGNAFSLGGSYQF